MASARTHYEVLQIDRHASQEVVQGAYRALLKDARAHPDLGGDAALAQAINEAYRVLSHPARRGAYDRELAQRPPPAASPAPRRHEPEWERRDDPWVRTQYILICPACRKRNLVRAEDALGSTTCGSCRAVLLPEKRAPQETDPQRAFRLGLFLFDRRMLDRARSEFQLAVRLKPGNALYQFWLGRSAYDGYLFEKARQAFHAAATIRPAQSQFHFWVGQSCMRLKRMDEAIVAFERALQLRPGHAATLLRLALCHFRLKEYARCETLLAEATAGEPRRPELPLLLGMSRLVQADRRGAARALQTALRLRPGDETIEKYLQACRDTGPLPSLRGLWRRLRGMKGAA